jgi:hypothetical protein
MNRNDFQQLADGRIDEAIMDFISDRPNRRPRRIRGMNLGDVHIQSTYICYI